jgi:epoxyqueuosine reductase
MKIGPFVAMEIQEITGKIKEKAIEIGFDACGIAEAKHLKEHETFLKSWLEKGLHAAMHYMENHFEKRVDPTQLVPGAKSVISVLLNYYPEKIQAGNVPVVAKYAYGNDYHFVLKDKLKQLLHFINSEIAPCNGRFFTDSAPVLDRAWAAEAGLGWIGKNTNLIVPHKGSFFFIGELIVDIELAYDTPIVDLCGSCTKCISACPTNALVVPYLLDSNRCISYHTIENKNEINPELKGKFQNRVFGCDICQDVCPWNRYSAPTWEKQFSADKKFLELTSEDWNSMDEGTFQGIFKESPVMRAGFNGIKKNLEFIG